MRENFNLNGDVYRYLNREKCYFLKQFISR